MKEEPLHRKGYNLPKVLPTRKEVIALITAAHIPRLESILIAGMKDAIRLHLMPTTMDAIASGISHIGGIPDLPGHIPWPQFAGESMAFLAQLSCADLVDYDTEHLLPPTGTLWFFIDNRLETEYPILPGRWVVYYDDADSAMYRRVFWPDAIPEKERYTPCKLSYSQEIQLPPYGSESLANLGLSEKMYEQENEVLQMLYQEVGHLSALCKELKRLQGWEPDWQYFRPMHQSLGYPESLQHDIQQEVHRNALRAANLKDDSPGANEWVLLLQIDSCDEANTDWSGTGRIYFMIHREALAQRDFSKAWVEFQYT